jgi:hypothetical protein
MSGPRVKSLVTTNQRRTIEGVLSMPRLMLCLLAAIVLCLCSIGADAQTVTTFEGIDAAQVAHPESDADTNGAVGTKQFMEWTNVNYQAYDKVTFAPVWAAPQPGPTPFTNNGVTNCNNFNPGDGVIIFDRLASRWVIAAHTPAPNYYYCIAVSSTDDLTSSSLKWYTYGFLLNPLIGANGEGVTFYPDWPKIATWPDAYYVGFDLGDPNNAFEDVAMAACAFDRTDMLIGATANPPQCFLDPTPVPVAMYLKHSLEPADVEGTTPPPAGSPEYFASIQNPVIDGVTTTSDSFNLWQFHVDWSNPANSTFVQSSVPVTAYTPGCYSTSSPGNTQCVPEASTATTGNHIDSVGDRMMFRFAYRNFGEYQSYLLTHTVQVATGTRTQTGIRWYELRGSGTPTVYQSGTISPDTSLYRFMPSIAQDQNGNAAVGYSVSSSSTHPGISASWWNLQSQTSPTEIPLYSGTGDEENYTFWGDYSSMTVDPVANCSFWYVTEYYSANQTGSATIWRTRISTFSIPGCGSVTLAPSSLTFGAQSVGTTSPSQKLILTNSQSVALNISSISFTGNNPFSFGETDDCGTSVAAGSTCAINVSFAPVIAGALSATLNVNDDAANSPQTANLTGTATSLPTLTLSTTTLNFGNQSIGTNSGNVAITVTNTGASTVTFSSILLTGANTSSFPESTNCPTSLTAGTGCTIYVAFAPAAAGTFSAAVTLTSNAYGSPQNIPLSGTGYAPVLLSSTSVAFGNVVTGTSKTLAAIKLTNQMPVTLTGIDVATSAPFSQVNTCGTTLVAGAHCTITLTFSPTVTGTQTGTVTITDSAPTSPQAIAVRGTGVLPVTLVPVSVAFGQVAVGTSSAAKVSTLTNNEKASIGITSVAITGAHPGDYSQTNTCGSTLAAGAQCTISVTFTPQAGGSRPASVTVTDTGTNSPQVLPVVGTGK